jgi:DNA topoisomerase-1
MPRVRRSDCGAPGFSRRRRGRGFEYLDENGRVLKNTKELKRIRELVIPPAWQDVWICPDEWGHLQAVGIDAAGRKQYLYHPRWRARRDQEKFDRMLEFARLLPKTRKACAADLKHKELDRERVLACAIRLLDRGFFRMGSEGYAEQNDTYGLATVRKKHVTLRDGLIIFDYPAKGGKRRLESVGDPEVCEVLRLLKSRRSGPTELLAYKRDGTWIDVKSSDINQYIKDAMLGDFSAKDFRTWNATVLAAVAVAVSANARSKTSRSRAISRAVKEVAHYLGNTPAVCRSSYIDPRVFDRFRSGWTISLTLERLGGAGFGELATQGEIELAVIDLLEDRRSSDAVEKVA